MLSGFFVLNEIFHGFFYSLRKIRKEKIKSILVFVLPLSVGTLFMWIIIEQNVGLEFLGFLGVGQIAATIESIVMQYFHPIYYQQMQHSKIEKKL